eukprot:8786814-Alexandrium_andersonii.AAC.1
MGTSSRSWPVAWGINVLRVALTFATPACSNISGTLPLTLMTGWSLPVFSSTMIRRTLGAIEE